MHPAIAPRPDTCATCRHAEPSRLDGWGYCLAGRTIEERALFLPGGRPCAFTPSRYRRAP